MEEEECKDVQVRDKAGKTLDLVQMGGRLYPRFVHANLRNVSRFQARCEDIVICAYPKSGTHWAFEIVRILLAGTVDLPMVEKDDTMIEDADVSVLAQLPSPRNLNTHYPFGCMSSDFWSKKARIIYITRDPRDTAVSFFHHHKKLAQYYNYHGVWSDYLHLFLEGNVDYGLWFDYTKGWEQGMKEHPDHPFLVLSYEAMKKNPLDEVRRIAEFLEVAASDELLEKVVHRTSFDAMQSQRKSEETQGDPPVMYRKGKIGDWKNHFSVSETKAFNEKFEKEMAGTEAYKLYSHLLQTSPDDNSNALSETSSSDAP